MMASLFDCSLIVLVMPFLLAYSLFFSSFNCNQKWDMKFVTSFKAEVPGSSLLGHLPKGFSLRLTWCPWLVGYYGTREISRGARKLARTPSLSKKKKKICHFLQVLIIFSGKIIPVGKFS